MGKKHFQTLFKDDRRENLANIIKLDLYFPSFVEEENNQNIFAEVPKTELRDTMKRVQKYKILGPDGWTIKFYLGFFDLIGGDILKVIEESRLNGRIHGPLNATF